MDTTYLINVGKNYIPDPRENVQKSLFKQYERVLFKSLITSFGLDMFIKDQHGGNVDTIYNVRQVGIDEKMTYKNVLHKQQYENNPQYDKNISAQYHSDAAYIARNRELSAQKKADTLDDAYTGKHFAPNDKTDLDHVVSAKEIHDDPGRILAGLRGEDLANNPDNLQMTNAHTNRSKKADTMDDFLERKGHEYTEEEKERMRAADTKARKSINDNINYTYYTSKDFWSNTAIAAGTVGIQMGLRQAMGLVLTEVWFSVRDKLYITGRTLKTMLSDIADGVRLGITRAKNKFASILSTFKEGFVGGLLASLTTTLCNIFFTTAKQLGRILRQSFASLTAAANILFFNPDNLLFGDRIQAVLKILATGASVVVGMLVSEAVAATGLGTMSVVGEVLSTFTGIFATGVLSCTFLYAIDSCEEFKKIINILNKVHTIEYDIAFYRQQAQDFEKYLSELLAYDLEGFKRETAAYANTVQRLQSVADDPQALSIVLKEAITEHGIALPYTGDFKKFMGCKTKTLHFS